ncbi:hypothetical protein ES705_01665 [subsurface metagenome]|nr:site-specific DNA-methyltransferase [Clostridia bacterium]
MKTKTKNYLDQILDKNKKYLEGLFDGDQLNKFYKSINYIYEFDDYSKTIEEFSNIYIKFVKKEYQKKYSDVDEKLVNFINCPTSSIKLIWGDIYDVLKSMESESIHLMVTSPPYYNARDYSIWDNLDNYLSNMRVIIKEAYRVLDNHRIFVFNVGDIFDNDNLTTKSVWGKRRIPLGAYFIKIFEEEGYTFVDDFIWDKGEVQSERQKNDDRPYPLYQYPVNCYEHILIFHKHRLDKTRFPCPVCGTLKVNGNTQSEIGLQSWECKNYDCFTRSKSNRGKRFSLKTIVTQSRQREFNIIDEATIRKWRRDIVKFPPVIKINSKGKNILGHTAPFPEDIPEMAIKFFSYKKEKVLDPFAGSFTTAIAAQKLDRVGIGVEINKDRFRVSIIDNIRKKLGLLVKFEEFDYL